MTSSFRFPRSVCYAALLMTVTGDLGTRDRLDAAFAREERRGLMVAAAARSAAVAFILGWLALASPERGLAYAWVLGSAAFFLVTGLAQLWLYLRGWALRLAAYLLILVDSLALAAVLLLPNPYLVPQVPPAIPLRYATFMYFFVMLMQAGFSFRPRLLLWTGLCGVGAWTAGFLWILTRPETITDPPVGASRAAMRAAYFDPNYVSARWGLGVTYPTRITAMGGHFLFDDDQETPNTMTAMFEFDNGTSKKKIIEFAVRGWITNHEAGIDEPKPGNTVGTVFYGSNGYLSVWDEDHSKYHSFIGREQTPGPSGAGSDNHWGNFIQAVRSRKASDLTAPIEEGAISAALMHLANISYRVGRSLQFDAATYSCKGDQEANRLFRRVYRKGFEVPEKV